VSHVVYKYPFDEFLFSVSDGAMVVPEGHVVHVGVQHLSDSLPTVWVQHDKDNHAQMTLVVIGTGREFEPLGIEHVGSVVCANGQLVWHVYRRLT